jgi:2-iminobutanoate/2-iminopropanoate deaminase
MRTILLALALLASVASAAEKKKLIHPKEFATGRPFSPGVLVDGTLYVAGQVGNDLKTGQRPESFEDEVKTCLDNIGIILKAGGMDYSDVVSVNVYLTDMDLFQRMNNVYVKVFDKEPKPVRTTVGVAKLVGTSRIEITVTARK